MKLGQQLEPLPEFNIVGSIRTIDQALAKFCPVPLPIETDAED